MTSRKGNRRGTAGRTARILLAVLAAMALVIAGCGTDEDDGTVTMARANWDSGYMQAAIYAQLIGELGYEVSDPADNTRDPNGFYPALASGQFDLWVNGWFPLHDIYLEGERVTGQSVDLPIEPVGFQVRSGALQGYMIDKATADARGITSMSQLADASVARIFDQDGDGLADLIGCNDGWGCQNVIDSHIGELGWGPNVEQISGDYNSLVAGVRDRVASGEPVLFYAWTPNWTYQVLTPGTDVVWLESPALDDEEASTEVQGLRGCASDPCNLGWAVSSIRAVGNEDFLDDNSDIRRLLEVVSIPLSDIAAQNAAMAGADLGYSEAQIKADAADWIEANRDTVDRWLATARG
ncbi:glycine betaine/L-proline ABC transporter substrate-binding protein ProX [Candidatus Poriferisocius sp.]|uniref:glycine betaine/L-proline ABC transporter substrate-binding protein ProX n=1 Tax=Candidatus Poriferisocius sp. TaxID=3101276 RepID=UPI003B018F4D